MSRKHEHLKAALTADPTYPDAAIRLAKMAWGSPVILDQRPASSPDAIRKLLDIAEAREYTLPEWSGSKDDIAQMREALKQFEKS